MIDLFPLALDGFVQIFQSYDTYVAIIVLLFTGVGAAGSQSMAIGAMGGYLAFSWIAINSGVDLYTNIFYVTLTLVMVGFGFKIVRLEAFGEAG